MGEARRFRHGGIGYGFVVWSSGGTGAALDPQRGNVSCADAGMFFAHAAQDQAAPLVLVHGFAQSAQTWNEVACALAHGRTVYGFELAGHGGSERPEHASAYALDEQAAALVAFLEAVMRQAGCKPVVVGYSLGGRVALAAALRDARAFGGLVLESAGLGPADDAERSAARERDARNAAALRTDGLTAFMNAWERLPLFATQRALPFAVRARVRAGRLDNDAEALARTFEGAGQHAMPDRAALLDGLRHLVGQGVPVHYLAGGLDAKYGALGEVLRAAGIGEVCVIEGAGHNVHMEAPKAFVAAVETAAISVGGARV